MGIKSSEKVKVVFVGSYQFSVFVLLELLQSETIDIRLIVTRRGLNGLKYPVEKFSDENFTLLAETYFFQDKRQQHEDILDKIREFEIDYLLCAGFPLLIPDDLLQAPKYGALNIHPSTLPRYKGADPIRHQIMADESHIGVTLHKMTPILDEGSTVAQAAIRNDWMKAIDYYIQELPRVIGPRLREVLESKSYIKEIERPANHHELACGSRYMYDDIYYEKDFDLEFGKKLMRTLLVDQHVLMRLKNERVYRIYRDVSPDKIIDKISLLNGGLQCFGEFHK